MIAREHLQKLLLKVSNDKELVQPKQKSALETKWGKTNSLS